MSRNLKPRPRSVPRKAMRDVMNVASPEAGAPALNDDFQGLPVRSVSATCLIEGANNARQLPGIAFWRAITSSRGSFEPPPKERRTKQEREPWHHRPGGISDGANGDWGTIRDAAALRTVSSA